ncbi:amino-acid acetyltransferase [Spirochaetia bacterium]|nr:amino-acid acetyltransferase [Spirochaetia bacterium]GHU31310.1 amino-acid acetyltransferase [Spirochaetia bacterium]
MTTSVDLIREAFHYQSRYNGATMVFKIEFPLVDHAAFSYLMRDIALLAGTGFRIVLVPGAKERIDAVLTEYGIVSRYHEGSRITPAPTLPFVEMAAFHVATQFMTELQAHEVDAVVGNFVRARAVGVINGIDFEHTGTVDRILNDSIRRILNQNMVVILPCIGLSRSGRPYNVPSDEIAVAAAAALNAEKLFLVSADDRFASHEGRITRLTPHAVEAILDLSQAEDYMQRTMRIALKALKLGIPRIHIVDGREDGVILRELFSSRGAGTMISADEYESIRPLEDADIPALLRLMEPLVQKGYLVRRDAAAIREKSADYAVFVLDGSVHACGALHNWGEGWGEIAAIATDPAYTTLGLGRRIVSYLIDRAEKQRLSSVFVLTTRTQDWFESLGFRESSLEHLPARRRVTYNSARNSKIFVLSPLPSKE